MKKFEHNGYNITHDGKDFTDYGMSLYFRGAAMYYDELDKLCKEKNDPNFFEGTCIIDDHDHIKTFEDEIAFLLLTYEGEAASTVISWVKDFGEKWEDEIISGMGKTIEETVRFLNSKCLTNAHSKVKVRKHLVPA